MQLNNPALFRQQCYIDGAWVDADSGATVEVTNPADGAVLGTVPKMGAAETRRAVGGGQRGVAGVAGADGQGAGGGAAPLVRVDAREPGGPGAADDRRAGQAADRVARRDRLRRVVRRVVRRGGQAGLRRHHPAAPGGQADRGDQAADRGGGVDHPLELPHRDDHPQVRAGAGGGVHGGGQAGEFDALFGPRPGRAGRAGGNPAGGVQRRHRRRRRDRRRADVEPDRPQADVHRLDRDRQGADGAMRANGEEGVFGTGRQRAVHRLRRRRPRRGGGRGDRVQIPQHRPDLRLRQPAAGPGRGLRRVRRPAVAGGFGPEGG